MRWTACWNGCAARATDSRPASRAANGALPASGSTHADLAPACSLPGMECIRPAMDNFSMPTLVTGAAGFIGAHVCRALRSRGEAVVGLDNYNDYYDPRLKRDRVAALCADVDIRVLDLADRDGLAALFDDVRPRRVVHLAAQAGVRHSLENPHAYVDSNLAGFANVLELCRD